MAEDLVLCASARRDVVRDCNDQVAQLVIGTTVRAGYATDVSERDNEKPMLAGEEQGL